MNKTKYKKKYEELKSKLEADEKAEHTNSHICIPFSWKVVGLFSALLGSIGLALFNFFVVFIPNWSILHIDEIFKPEEEINKALIGVYQFGIFPQLLFQYLLIGLCFICLAALIKDGFDKLKIIEDEGLIFGSIFGLIFGLVFEFIVGLTVGFIVLISGLVGGLVFGTVVLIAGFIGELQNEFS